MKPEYKKSIENIIRANKLHNKANPLFNHKVDDAEYDLSYNSATQNWGFANKQKVVNKTIVENIIVVLESPHIDEFDDNGGLLPLMKDSSFKQHLCNLIGKSSISSILDKQVQYKIYLINAIQLQCSLGVPTEYYRDFVFLYYWEKLFSDFETRLRALINVNTKAIINLCTKGSHEKCYTLYNSFSKQMDYMYKSCGKRFISKIYGRTSSVNILQDLVNDSINKVVNGVGYPIPTALGTHPSTWRLGGEIK